MKELDATTYAMATTTDKVDEIQFDVILADQDAACRCSNTNALTRFGFPSSRIYGVGDVYEAIEKMKELEGKYAQERKVPVLVFLPPMGCSLFSEQKFWLKHFLVRVSDSGAQVTKAASGEGAWDCTIPKELDEALVLAFTDIVQAWVTAESSKEQRMISFHERAAQKREARAKEGLRKTLKSTARPSSTAMTELAQTVCTESSAGAQSTSKFSGAAASTSSDRGNSLSSLAHLLPTRTPFEDVHVISHAGSGRFGSVYKARWGAFVVALKVIRHTEADVNLAAFEGALSSSLAHPGLVTTFKHSIREATDAPNEVWIVQDFCGLGTLSEAAQSQRLLNIGDFPRIAEVCCEIACAVSYLHYRGVVHRDLTGNNVLLTMAQCSKGFISKVGDFGMARVLGSSDYINTKSFGTVASVPPEMFALSMEGPLTTKVDVYAFGMLIYMLCSGQLPWQGLSIVQIIATVARGNKPVLPPSVPQNLAALYDKCTAYEAATRPEFEKIVCELLDIIGSSS
eukprot:gnl/TRDRNA2_/TRDRNA2_176190_c0_seq2.p1 gnl/TRDRNA2_/TRDRNA2_176190_c0~~gnl/TRDRNA2_/TRDRNA2_176190_c0_seq2.p1  ORF type:complete len:513 (+),score=49.89 gnl/TRDRNA2_/TRDRNA2_176190_c0_seq2:2-1540(+)